jgi:phage terminase Nu1 subunit (DNA packaging protein)
MSYLVSKKAAAEFFGVSVQALDGWFTAGCPVAKRDQNDRIELLDLRVMTQWRIDRAGDGGELDRERTRLTKAQADKTELEVAELRAELVRAPVLENHWQNMVAAARAKLLSLPSKLAPQIAGPDQLTRVQDMLHAGVFEALAELAGDAFPDNIRVRVDKAASQPHDLGMEATTEADGHAVGKRAPAAQSRGQRGAGPVPKRKGALPKRGARRAE